MHALPTIHAIEQRRADNTEAQRILNEHGDTTAVFAADPVAEDAEHKFTDAAFGYAEAVPEGKAD